MHFVPPWSSWEIFLVVYLARQIDQTREKWRIWSSLQSFICESITSDNYSEDLMRHRYFRAFDSNFFFLFLFFFSNLFSYHLLTIWRNQSFRTLILIFRVNFIDPNKIYVRVKASISGHADDIFDLSRDILRRDVDDVCAAFVKAIIVTEKYVLVVEGVTQRRHALP